MNKNHNADPPKGTKIWCFPSHRSKAVERTFEEVRSQRREKFMHCFQQVLIYIPTEFRKKPGFRPRRVWQCFSIFFFFLGGGWNKFGDLHKKNGLKMRRGCCWMILNCVVAHLWCRNISNFQWYIFQNTSERDIVWVWGSGFDIYLLSNMHTTHPGKLAWQWTKTSNRRCISCHTWCFLTIAGLNFLGGYLIWETYESKQGLSSSPLNFRGARRDPRGLSEVGCAEKDQKEGHVEVGNWDVPPRGKLRCPLKSDHV